MSALTIITAWAVVVAGACAAVLGAGWLIHYTFSRAIWHLGIYRGCAYHLAGRDCRFEHHKPGCVVFTKKNAFRSDCDCEETP